MNDIEQFKISVEIPISYIHLNTQEDRPLLIFFHGFADSSSAFLKRAYPDPNNKYEVLAINGPFPIPQNKDGIWKPAFGWYFSDFSNNTTYIHPQVAAKAVNDLLTHLNLQNRRKILIGFSQGAFFVPHLLPYLTKVERIVAIGAAYRPQDYPPVLDTVVDAIHGSDDEIITFKSAFTSFQSLKAKNPRGEFVEFKDMRHTMNTEARDWLSKRIDQVFDES